jgi:DNA polymerase-4
VFDQFELDRPVRLLGVRLELTMPDTTSVTAHT